MEDPETLETKEYPRTELPAGASEGDALIEDGGALRLDKDETQARAARIAERFNKLKKR